ncbi:hypothetical protein EBR66_05665 [bacterium]|nr:hypothetical protein [bacterium]
MNDMLAQRILFIVFLLTPLSTFAMSCAGVTSYSIGTVDSRFGISTDRFAKSLAAAEAVWETPLGREVFSYATSSGAITISLIYDQRQAKTQSLQKTSQTIDAFKTGYDAISVSFQDLASTTALRQKQLRDDFSVYKKDESDFNALVAAANSRGGATGDEYTSFLQQKQALDGRFAALKQRETALNSDIGIINTVANLLTTLAQDLNAYVARYNTTVASQGEFEEGYYQEKNGTHMIGVYSYENETQLTRLLAHEFGHALGMEHASTSRSIMYRVNKEENLTPSPEDLTLLQRACK